MFSAQDAIGKWSGREPKQTGMIIGNLKDSCGLLSPTLHYTTETGLVDTYSPIPYSIEWGVVDLVRQIQLGVRFMNVKPIKKL